MPVANAMAGGHRDCPVLVSVAQWPEIQPLVYRGQIVLLTSRNGRTDGSGVARPIDYTIYARPLKMVGHKYGKRSLK